MKTIRIIFISFISLILFYGILIQFVGDSLGDTSQNMWNRNKIFAQDYIYSTDTRPYVIIGSSLSYRMIKDSLNPELFNLSLPGQSVLDCINLIKVAKSPTRKIFIETNFINTTLNEDFVNSLTTSPRYELKEKVKFLRQENQPVGVALSLISKLEEKLSGTPATENTSPETSGAEATSIRPSEQVFNSMLDQKREEFTHFDTSLIDQTIRELKEQVDILTQKSIEVVFYEIPVEEQLMELPRPKIIREMIGEAFPKDRYRYIEMPLSLNLTTTDGLHLDEASARTYTAFFNSRIELTGNTLSEF